MVKIDNPLSEGHLEEETTTPRVIGGLEFLRDAIRLKECNMLVLRIKRFTSVIDVITDNIDF